MTKKFFAIAAISLLLVGCSVKEDSTVEEVEAIEAAKDLATEFENATGLESVEEVVDDLLRTDEKNSGTIIGSCDVIAESSTCIEYSGSIWTWQIIELGCSGEGMTPSRDVCPAGSVGGCRVGAGTASEMTTWLYDFGGEPIDAENEKYATAACNATLGAIWTE